ncbi:OmpA family protein [Paracoccus sediminicola]|uniref:OmpA family protein n=1 Tax=Paracoccus sediminicola TaxID=3017783 RepID=UPI0022F096DE|nr:OmpA family protein [Paracoccus sediminicola]WBU55853.1 OmpA family protein [Paracoccus sediminicola]
MTRFSANSTALAALISLGLVSPSGAEITLSAEDIQQQGPARAEAMGRLDTLLRAELDAGLRQDQLSCLDGSERPCADDMAVVTPAGVSVQTGPEGQIILAPAELQPYEVDAEGMLVPRGNELNKLAKQYLQTAQQNADVLTGENAAPSVEAAEAEAEAEAERAEADAEAAFTPNDPNARAQQNGQDGNVDPSISDSASPQDAPTEEPQIAAAPETERDDEAQAREDELAERLAADQSDDDAEAEAEEDDSEPAEAEGDDNGDQEDAEPRQADAAPSQVQDSFADEERRLTEEEANRLEQGRIDNMGRLNRLLAQEVEAGLTPDELMCKDGSQRPCDMDTTSLVTPEGVAVDVTEQGRLILAAMDRQQYRISDDGELVARGSNTEAAKEAAEAEAPTAEAFNADAEAEGDVVSESVTEDSARSSAEDFETTITEAIERAADRQSADAQASESDDDDDSTSDLAKVALAGLGALAVGQVLNGNREVALNTGDRVIVTRADGSQQVLKDENALLRQPGNEVQTENYSDGSSRTVVTRPDGSQVVTLRASDLSVLRRIHVAADGTETVLIDESVEVPPVELSELPQAPAPRPDVAPTSEEELRDALAREAAIDRRFTLTQVRSIPEVRNLVAPVDIDAITFDTGSAAIDPDQARQLATLGTVLEQAIDENPREVFLIEGHTDAVGAAAFNLALSDRRAESVALALSEYFDVPPENLVVQGYGEEYLKVQTLVDERANRRASVRRITDLLASAN